MKMFESSARSAALSSRLCSPTGISTSIGGNATVSTRPSARWNSLKLLRLVMTSGSSASRDADAIENAWR
jgi:hypothetical protein